MPFEEVDYWPELVEIMIGAKSMYTLRSISAGGAQAGLYHRFWY